MIQLNDSTVQTLPKDVRWRAYERHAVKPGIVHMSVGNFHRAHQAWFIDQLLALPGHEGWGICGVSVLDDESEREKIAAMQAQDNLYTLTQFPPDGTPQTQVVGSIIEYISASETTDTVLARLASPQTRLVTLTITEGGYNLDRLGLYRLDTPEVAAELAAPAHPRTAFGFIVEALRRRRDAGIAPFTVLSCDNLRGNGEVARRAALTHAAALDPMLAGWINTHVAFPSSMVDRITPAVSPEEAARLNARSGIEDRLPVYCEAFAQWVIEDRFCNGRPSFELAGVQMVDDVHTYEMAKVRMLNGSHSVLAYPAQLAGLERVDEAMAEPMLRTLLDDFMEQDVTPYLCAPPGVDLHAYKESLLARFANPTVSDQLRRITADGAVKLPVFLGGTFAAVLSHGAPHIRLAFLLACFVRYLAGVDDQGHRFAPREPNLQADDLALALSPEPRDALRMSFLSLCGIEPQGAFAESFLKLRAAMEQDGTMAVLRQVLAVTTHC